MAIEQKKLFELLSYGFFPSGIGFKGLRINRPVLTYKKLMSLKPIPYVDLDMIEHILLQNLQKYQDKKCTLLFSGGIDSTYLALLMQRLHIDFNLLHIKFKKYDESKFAKDVAKRVLNMPIDVITYNPQNTNKILKLMNMPYERGSVILTGELLQSKKCREYVIAGDSADCLFMPSFEKEHLAIRTNIVNSASLRKDILLQLGVKYHQYASNALEQMLLFDILHEIPYYYYDKYQMLRRSNQTIILPYQDLRLLRYAFACKELHSKSNKFYLKELVKRYTNHKFIKKAFKVDKKDIINITPQVLKQYDFYGFNELKLNRKEKKKVLFLLAIFLKWKKFHTV